MSEDKQILTDEQEKEIGMIQQTVELVAKNIIAILVLVPAAYMLIKGMSIPDGYYTLMGAVVTYYFTKG